MRNVDASFFSGNFTNKAVIQTNGKQRERSVGSAFAAYVSRNIFGMLGISCYIIVDTFFISVAAGSDGITVLNLCLPVYNVIYAIGAMLGTGSAIRYAVAKGSGSRDAELYFSNACLWSMLLGTVFVAAAALVPDGILRLMGGDADIVRMGIPYLRTFMLFTPFFMLNFVVTSFVRNDHAPSLAMAATLSGSLFNLLFDYIFMFPMHMGMFGAALATAFSPIASLLVCSLHWLRGRSQVRFIRQLPSLKRLIYSCQVGVSAFVGEFSSGVITVIFNFLILELAGNVGVAAYGITANLALVVTALYNGIAQGSQPIISEHYARKQHKNVRTALLLGLATALVLASLSLLGVWLLTEPIVAAFNSEGSALMHDYAFEGLRLYFLGFLFAGLNTVIAGYFSAADQPFPAMVVSLSRGVVMIAVCAVVLARWLGMTGVWLAFPAAELLTLLIAIFFLLCRRT